MDDYHRRFVDGAPTSCVTDVLRSRVVCPDGASVVRLQEILLQGFRCAVDAGASEGGAGGGDEGGAEADLTEVATLELLCCSTTADTGRVASSA